MAQEIVLAVLSPVVEHTIVPIKTHICYALYCKSNLQNLKEEVGKLKNAGESLRHRMDEETRNGKVIEEYVRHWLLQVDGIIQKMERELAEDEDRAQKKCSAGLCPNFMSRYQLGKKAKKELATVATRLDQHAKFAVISHRAALPATGAISTKGYQTMESRMSIFEDVMNALKVADVNMIGVCGMGGIGKTTMVQEVAREAVENKLFDQVVFASVTRTPDIKKIQEEIADQLGLIFDEQTDWGRANRLRERLKKEEKKILFVLDDLWEVFNLETVGISLKDEHKGCKMLLTSRESDVLSSGMGVQKNFPLRNLHEEEAWGLFKNTAGGNFEDPRVESVASKIAKKCAGLPVAIVTVAKALTDKSLPQWKDALRELQKPSPRNFTGVPGEVYGAIELSYKHLESEELKSTFLLCSRMGYSASIEDLLKYGIGLGLFFDVATIEEARNKVYSLVLKLKNSCLLLDSNTSKQFSIHDVVRDVAISIAFRDRDVFVKSSNEVELEWSDKDSLKYTEIWLHGNSIGLSKDLKYRKLKVFSMHGEDPSLEIPGNIFGGMQKLKVLGLTNFSLPSLPSSLHLLKNLFSLCLHQSSLGEIAIIGELKNLEILSFVKSTIKHLPTEIRELTKLKLLDLSDCSELEVISPNVISSLSLLQELYMRNSFHRWDIGPDNASLVELEHLSHLTNLEIHVPDSRVISKDLFSKNLERHRILIGDVWDWDWDGNRDRDGVCETSRKLKLNFKESTDHLKHEILMLLKRTEDLYLFEVNGVKNVIELEKEGFPHLKHLHVHDSPEVQFMIDMINGIPSNISLFPMLESLYLHNLASLEKIYHGILRERSCGKLKILEVENCDKLRNLFSFSMALGLLQLQSIKISECRNMEEIVAEESDEFDNEATNVMEFTQLRIISLNDLPLLRNFCSREKTSSLPQTQPKSTANGMELGEVSLEDNMQSPTQLFDEKIVFPNLEVLELSSMKIERLWRGQHPAIAVSIQNLQRLDVRKCGSLRYIFSTSMVKSLVQLTRLRVEDCESLEEIIVTEASDEEETTSTMLFPKLESVWLWNLPKLKQFCTGCLIECPLLKSLNIYKCSGLETFISDCGSTKVTIRNEAGEVRLKEKCHSAIRSLFNEKVAFPSLTAIFIYEMDNLEKIWHDQLAAGCFSELRSLTILRCRKLVNIFPSISLTTFQRLEVWNNNPQGIPSFQNLRSVKVLGCDDLKDIFPFSIARNLPQLEKLEITRCGVEAIVAKLEDDETAPRFEFPQLTSLELDDLGKLSHFYPEKHTWECPKLKSLAASGCGNVKLFGSKFLNFQEIQVEAQHDDPIQQPLFFVEKVISNLEELSLGGQDTSNTSIMWHCQLSADFYSILKVLKLQNFKRKSDRIPFGFVERLRNLETLTVKSSSFKRLFLNEGIVEEEHKWKLAQLRNLILSSVHDMRHLWEQDHQLAPLIHNLKTLQVMSCHSLVNLAPSSASFQNLLTLDVWSCNGLSSLITSSTAKSLAQLVNLMIDYCDMITDVVGKQGDETEDEIVFCRMEYLKLQNLKSLTSFCPGNDTFKFPSLKEVSVRGCPKMQIFSPGLLSTPKLQGVQGPKNKKWWRGNLNATIQQFYTEMLGFNGVESLKLSDFPHLREIWHDRLPFNFISDLYELIVDECAFVSNAIPSNLLKLMNNLGRLTVSKCDSLEGVFDLIGLNAAEWHLKLLSNLRQLCLIDLPRLMHLWNMDPQRILDLRNLNFLVIKNCGSLRNIFTPSMAFGLVQLKKIEIRKCDMMEVIITKEGEDEAAMDKIIFPSLKVILLESLPKLTGICSGSAILEIPFLEQISLDNCPNMKAFLKEQEPNLASEGKIQGLDMGDHDISTPPLFNHKVRFSNLKDLKVGWNDIMDVIQHDQFPKECFCKLEVLELVHFPSDYVDFPFHFIRRFTNLKNLVLSDAAFQEIVLHEETDGEEKHMGIFVQLEQLKLSKLPKLVHLVHLSKEDPQSFQIFQKLETLRVLECGVVKILMPSATSFQCLQILEVSNCHRLINLMNSSTAKQLVELKRMSITKCHMIVEIVASEENEVENEVVFHKLRHMRLHSLPSLTSFYSRNCALMFPSLEEVLVVECPKMKYFAPGVISTPALEGVLLTEKDREGYWEGNIDATIRKIFIDMADGSAQSKLPSSSKQLTCETADDNEPKIVSERLASEDLPVTKNPDSSKDLPLMVKTVLKTKEEAIKGVSIGREIAQLTSSSQDSHATSNEKKDPAQGQNSSTPVDIESHISPQVPKDPHAADKINLPALKGQDSWATSNDQEDASEDQNFSFPTSAETYISGQVQMTLASLAKQGGKQHTATRKCLHPKSKRTIRLKQVAKLSRQTPVIPPEEEGAILAAIEASLKVPSHPPLVISDNTAILPTQTTSPVSIQGKRMLLLAESSDSDDDAPLVHRYSVEKRTKEATSSSMTNATPRQFTPAPFPFEVVPFSQGVLLNPSSGILMSEATVQEDVPMSTFGGNLGETKVNGGNDFVSQGVAVGGHNTPMNAAMITADPSSSSHEEFAYPPVQKDLLEIDKDQIMHASSIENCSNLVPTSPGASVQQVPALSCTSPAKTECSQELMAFSASRQMQDISTSPISDGSSPSHTDFETLIISMERMLHTSSASSAQPSSSSNSRYQSHESIGVSFENYSHSMARMKKSLVKSPTEVASSVDRFLLLSALMNLRTCRLLNSQLLEIVQAYIENFDSFVTNDTPYEQQIDSTSALKFAMEDNKNRISELMNRYEDLSSKSSTLSANKQALKRKLHEIEVEEARICDDMDDLRAQLVTRKEKLETHMKVISEAERQQSEAVETGKS